MAIQEDNRAKIQIENLIIKGLICSGCSQEKPDIKLFSIRASYSSRNGFRLCQECAKEIAEFLQRAWETQP